MIRVALSAIACVVLWLSNAAGQQTTLRKPDVFFVPTPPSVVMAMLDLARVGSLTFAAVDLDRYPAFRVALEAGRAGGTYPAVLCAADEVAVEAFLRGAISFVDIPGIVERALEIHQSCAQPQLDDILLADRWARNVAHHFVSLLESPR